MPTDAELRDAAVAELKKTTAGWLKANGQPNYPSGVAPSTTHWAKALDLLAQIGAAPPPPPPPPPPTSAYFTTDYSAGTFQTPWTTLFSYSAPGYVDLTQGAKAGTPDGRVSVVLDPAGSGEKVARFEMRDVDPGWPNSVAVQKSEVRSTTQLSFDELAVQVGDVRYFKTRLYLPLTSSERFEWAQGGSNAFFDVIDLHPGISGASPAFQLGWYPSTPQWAKFRLYGGPTVDDFSFAPLEVNLFQLTDSSGARLQGNHNRWIDLLWGMRFAPDSTGWLEVAVDGASVFPRKSRPTMWGGDTGMYFKHGLYKRKDASFPETGRSVIYFGTTTISR